MSQFHRHFKDRHSNEPDVICMLHEKDETKQKKLCSFWRILEILAQC
jgi:hypothetical protein